MVKKIAHVGIATDSIAVTAEFYRLLGLEVDSMEIVEDQRVKVALLPLGDSAIELLEATEEGSPLDRFLERRGEGLHHLTFEVEDIEAQLRILKERDIRLIDERPRRGAGGSLIAFVHPDSTGGVLVELLQPAPESQP